MNPFLYATHSNIKRLQNLLDTSVGPTERQTLERLIAEERAKAKLQAPEANRLRSGQEERPGRIAQVSLHVSLHASLLESLVATIRSPFRRQAFRASPPACSAPQPTTAQSKGSRT